MASRSDFISRQRIAVSSLLEALDSLVALKRQYDALTYGHATLGLLDADFAGTNAGMSAAEFKSAVTSAKQLNDAFTAGGTISLGMDTTLYKMKL